MAVLRMIELYVQLLLFMKERMFFFQDIPTVSSDFAFGVARGHIELLADAFPFSWEKCGSLKCCSHAK